ncbi:MAG: DUF2029 domain-containing protein [Gammaproteobacteria bacterium]|nr:DUF2029 domain-containing protein [Gammaproteobacteria bacterium]
MRRNMAYSLIIGFMALIGYVYAHNIHLIISQHLNTDMILAYVSGWMLNLNTPPYTLSDAYLAAHSASTKTIPNLSPPFSLMISALIARYISYKNFFMGFNIVSILLNIIALSMLYLHFFSEKKRSLLMVLLFISLNFLYMPSIISVICGETSFLLNALVIFSYLSLTKNRDIQAGFFLALAINIKLFFCFIFFVIFCNKKIPCLDELWAF